VKDHVSDLPADQGFGLVDIEDDIAVLESADGPGDDLADPRGEFGIDFLLFGIPDFLENDLFGRLGRDPPQGVGRELDQGLLHALPELVQLERARLEIGLDEAPGAYKDINTVMDNQNDLVDIVVELSPLAVIKG